MAGVLKMAIHAMAWIQEGIMYGMTIPRENHFLPGMSLLTMSQANTPPSTTLRDATQAAISSECPSGLYSIFREIMLLKSLCQ